MKSVLNRLNSVAAVGLAFLLMVLVGNIALMNRVRWDASEQQYYNLSDKTMAILDQLNEEDRDVVVTALFEEDHKLYDYVKNLLEEYVYRSHRHVRVNWVDPFVDRAEAERLGIKYDITAAYTIVVDFEGKSRILSQTDIADMEVVAGRDEPVVRTFKGEQALSSAIQSLIEGETPTVYMLLGHGEHRAGDFDPIVGYSDMATIAVRDNIQLAELMISADKKIPEDAAALVIAGPTQKMGEAEVEIIEDYLSQGGRLLVLLDAMKETGMEGMLRRWGVALRNDIVIDPENTQRGNDVHVRRYNEHPISMKMHSIVVFILPRSIEPPLDEAGKPLLINDLQTLVPLLYTSEDSWSETNLEDSAPKFDEDSGDRRGPIYLGVAIERGAAQDELDVQIEPSRMVVIGDSDFVSNGAMIGGNSDLFMSSLNWLLDRDETLPIPAKPLNEVVLTVPRNRFRVLGWINLAVIPSFAVMLGLFVWLRRRK